MDGNETNVTPATSSPEPAKTAENSTAAVAPGVAPGAPAELVKETPVSPTPEAKVQFLTPDSVVEIVRDYLLAHPPTIGIKQLEDLGDMVDKRAAGIVQGAHDEAIALAKEYTDAQIKAAQAAIVEEITELVRPNPSAPAVAAPGAPAAPHVLVVGDPVKVWADAQHKDFRLGKVLAIHDGALAFDVELDDGSATKVPADGLAFDDRR